MALPIPPPLAVIGGLRHLDHPDDLKLRLTRARDRWREFDETGQPSLAALTMREIDRLLDRLSACRRGDPATQAA